MMYLDDLLRASAELTQRGPNQQWRGFAYDSHLAQTGDLFVALQTERADGHMFINEALAVGVNGIVCSYLPAHVPPDVTVLSFHTAVAQVHDVPVNTPISYGGTFITGRPSRIATIPVGYADGFRRAPHSWHEVLVGGKRALVVAN